MNEDAHLEADYEDKNGAPHGEEQGQIDWLETRADEDFDPADWDPEDDLDRDED